MTYKRQKNEKPVTKSKRNIAVVIIVIIFLLCIAVAVGFFASKFISERLSQPPTDALVHQNSSSSSSGSSASNTSTTSNGQSPDEQNFSSQTPIQYDGEDPNSLDSITGTISYAGPSESGISIRAAIDQSVSGQCRITLTNSARQTFAYDVDLSIGPTSSFCVYDGPLTISKGVWSVTIDITGSDGKKGKITGEMEL